jgi:hypothetical protein
MPDAATDQLLFPILTSRRNLSPLPLIHQQALRKDFLLKKLPRTDSGRGFSRSAQHLIL